MLFILDGDPRPILCDRLCSVGSERALVDARGRIARVWPRRLEGRNRRVLRAGRGALPQVPLRYGNGGLMLDLRFRLVHCRCRTPPQPRLRVLRRAVRPSVLSVGDR